MKTRIAVIAFGIFMVVMFFVIAGVQIKNYLDCPKGRWMVFSCEPSKLPKLQLLDVSPVSPGADYPKQKATE